MENKRTRLLANHCSLVCFNPWGKGNNIGGSKLIILIILCYDLLIQIGGRPFSVLLCVCVCSFSWLSLVIFLFLFVCVCVLILMVGWVSLVWRGRRGEETLPRSICEMKFSFQRE